jgi:hypothetical protein
VDDRLAVLDVRLQNLENSTVLYDNRISKLEKDTEALARSAASSVPATQATTAQSNTDAPAATGFSPASPPVSAPLSGDETKRIDLLEKELAAIKSSAPMQDSEHVSHSIRLLSAFHRLSDKVLSGKPYADALSAFEDLIGDSTSANKPLTQLASFAESGVPTLAELLTSFDNAADQLSTTQAVPPPEAGAWDRFVFNVTHLVRVRRIDETQTGKGIDAIVGRAAGHLDKGEIEAAYAEINNLPETIRPDFSGWLEDAQIAIDAPGMIEQLEEQVMEQVFRASTQRDTPASRDKGLNVQ